MAQSYRGRRPENARSSQDGDCPWCTWLRCAHCRVVTLHAVIADSLTQRWRTEGCDRERHNRLTDRCRRRIERRLAALAGEGVGRIAHIGALAGVLNGAAFGSDVIDFNEAYNPYCAYNEQYDCPFPPPSNRLDVPIRAGELDVPVRPGSTGPAE